jgi:hypothetical protein
MPEATPQKKLPDPAKATLDSFDVKRSEGFSDKLVDAIEMIGEEQAAGFKPPPSEITPGMRYLHASRTIHQLVTDRNRAVGIYLGTASLLMTASGIIINANPQTADLMVPMDLIKRWCLPITFAVLTVLALLMAFLLIRTRVGMIYEVAKMNALLGLPLGRVSHINPLSIFFILQMIISLAGGVTGALFTIFMCYREPPMPTYAGWLGALVGIVITAGLVALYAITVSVTTSDERLRNVK